MAVAFAIVGSFFVGQGLLAFALAGAAVGLFSIYRKSDEIVLGVVAGAAAYVATAVAIHAFPLGMGMVFVVGICGGFGAIVAIDDRL